MTQCEMVLHYMRQYGSITPMEALDAFSCTRLGARIWDLKQRGHQFIKSMETSVNKFGQKVHYARYRLREAKE